jgi:hypothetical protein
MFVFFITQIHSAFLKQFITKIMLDFRQTFILIFFLVTVVNFSNLVHWGRKLDFCSGNGAAKKSLIRRCRGYTNNDDICQHLSLLHGYAAFVHTHVLTRFSHTCITALGNKRYTIAKPSYCMDVCLWYLHKAK